jgi:hypothetical protein
MKATWTRVSLTQVVSKVPCKLGAVVIAPSAADKAGYVTLYDGESTNDPALVTIRSGTGTTRSVVFPEPVYCKRGLYAVIGTDSEVAFIMHEPTET